MSVMHADAWCGPSLRKWKREEATLVFYEKEKKAEEQGIQAGILKPLVGGLMPFLQPLPEDGRTCDQRRRMPFCGLVRIYTSCYLFALHDYVWVASTIGLFPAYPAPT